MHRSRKFAAQARKIHISQRIMLTSRQARKLQAMRKSRRRPWAPAIGEALPLRRHGAEAPGAESRRPSARQRSHQRTTRCWCRNRPPASGREAPAVLLGCGRAPVGGCGAHEGPRRAAGRAVGRRGRCAAYRFALLQRQAPGRGHRVARPGAAGRGDEQRTAGARNWQAARSASHAPGQRGRGTAARCGRRIAPAHRSHASSARRSGVVIAPSDVGA